jgi:hypothetical protein
MTTIIYSHNAVQTTIILPDDLLFENQSEFTTILQNVDHSLDGVCVVEEFIKQNGLSIILTGTDNRAWITKTTLAELLTLESLAGKVLTLTLADSRTFQVMLDRSSGSAIGYKQLFDIFPTTDEDYFWVNLKFITL